MISYFPKPYEDELLYSLLARYYAKAGYMKLSYAIEDLYVHKYTRPDMEFINPLKDEVIQLLTEDITKEDLILKHTMFLTYVLSMDCILSDMTGV